MDLRNKSSRSQKNKRSDENKSNSAKRRRLEAREDDLKIKVAIPDQYVGLLLGYRGSNINKIKQKCDAKIHVSGPHDVLDNHLREVTITGTPLTINLAKKALWNFLLSHGIKCKQLEPEDFESNEGRGQQGHPKNDKDLLSGNQRDIYRKHVNVNGDVYEENCEFDISKKDPANYLHAPRCCTFKDQAVSLSSSDKSKDSYIKKDPSAVETFSKSLHEMNNKLNLIREIKNKKIKELEGDNTDLLSSIDKKEKLIVKLKNLILTLEKTLKENEYEKEEMRTTFDTQLENSKSDLYSMQLDQALTISEKELKQKVNEKKNIEILLKNEGKQPTDFFKDEQVEEKLKYQQTLNTSLEKEKELQTILNEKEAIIISIENETKHQTRQFNVLQIEVRKYQHTLTKVLDKEKELQQQVHDNEGIIESNKIEAQHQAKQFEHMLIEVTKYQQTLTKALEKEKDLQQLVHGKEGIIESNKIEAQHQAKQLEDMQKEVTKYQQTLTISLEKQDELQKLLNEKGEIILSKENEAQKLQKKNNEECLKTSQLEEELLSNQQNLNWCQREIFKRNQQIKQLQPKHLKDKTGQNTKISGIPFL